MFIAPKTDKEKSELLGVEIIEHQQKSINRVPTRVNSFKPLYLLCIAQANE